MGRFKKDCPIPGCGKQNILYLSIYLSKIHRLNQKEKEEWLKKAVKSSCDEDLHTSDVSKLKQFLATPAKNDIQSANQFTVSAYINQIKRYGQMEFEDAIKYALKNRGPWIKTLIK